MYDRTNDDTILIHLKGVMLQLYLGTYGQILIRFLRLEWSPGDFLISKTFNDIKN